MAKQLKRSFDITTLNDITITHGFYNQIASLSNIYTSQGQVDQDFLA